MAVFDKKVLRKVCIDDTQTLTVNFESAQNVDGHTEYVIRVQRGLQPKKSWYVCKRFNDFVALHGVVQASGIGIPLPRKKIIGNMDRNFIAERQVALQNYLNAILMNPILASSLGVRRFLDPESYVLSLQEQALQHVSMALRSEVHYELVKPITEMGWRLRKHYFLVKARSNPKNDYLLQWVEYGPDKYLDDKDLAGVLKCLVGINHPLIEKLQFVHCGDGGGFVVRQFHEKGTLRDAICNSDPKLPFVKKYGNPKQPTPLPLVLISKYGYEILEALLVLHDKSIPYGHLHLGNVLIVDGSIRLLDIENCVLGLPAYYRPFFIQHKKICTMEAIDVYSFGHVLFEMMFGYPLHESVCDSLPTWCPTALREVLELILCSESCKSGLPTLRELIQQPLFTYSGSVMREVRLNFKLATSLRVPVRLAVEQTEARLREEQRLVRQQKKLAKVQELLSSEEEMKKRKQKLKEERKANHKQMAMSGVTSSKQSPPKSDSPTSTSTATSVGTVTPPLVGPGRNPVSSVQAQPDQRSALLDSICTFDKSALKQKRTAASQQQPCS